MYIKYIPFIMFLIMWIHTGLLLLGIDGPCANTIAGCSIFPSIIILVISDMLRFCWLHKTLTIYSLTIDLCINWQYYIGFGILLTPLRLISFSIGIIIFILLIINMKAYIVKCVNIKRYLEYVKYNKELIDKDN